MIGKMAHDHAALHCHVESLDIVPVWLYAEREAGFTHWRTTAAHAP